MIAHYGMAEDPGIWEPPAAYVLCEFKYQRGRLLTDIKSIQSQYISSAKLLTE